MASVWKPALSLQHLLSGTDNLCSPCPSFLLLCLECMAWLILSSSGPCFHLIFAGCQFWRNFQLQIFYFKGRTNEKYPAGSLWVLIFLRAKCLRASLICSPLGRNPICISTTNGIVLISLIRRLSFASQWTAHLIFLVSTAGMSSRARLLRANTLQRCTASLPWTDRTPSGQQLRRRTFRRR